MIDLLNVDCMDYMRTLPDKAFDLAIVDPPYGVGDFWKGGDTSAQSKINAIRKFVPMPGLPPVHVEAMQCCLGLEPNPMAYIAHLVLVFREVRRVLADDGTLWLNLGDSYAASGRGGNPTLESSTLDGGQNTQTASIIGRSRKDVSASQRINTPGRKWRAPPGELKRKDLIGIPWRAAFALQADGWYLRQGIIWDKPNPMPESVTDRCTKAHEDIFLLSKSEIYYFDGDAIKEPVAGTTLARLGQSTLSTQLGSDRVPGKTNGNMHAVGGKETRNKRSVWRVTTKPFKDAHFATYPPDLIEPCILAGSRIGDTVLDPFNGSGTTGAVAVQHGRNYVGIDLNPDYMAMAQARIAIAEMEKRDADEGDRIRGAQFTFFVEDESAAME